MAGTRNITTLNIQHEKKSIPAKLHIPEKDGCRVPLMVILTHGAGGDMDLPQLVTIANTLQSNGFSCLRFTCKGLNIVYRTRVYTTVLKYVHKHKDELKTSGVVLAGRSMGSRAAAGTANELYDTELSGFILGVVCLSYPLHPPSDTNNLRDSLLLEMKHSCLILNGSRDEMCQQDLMESTLERCESPDQPMKDDHNGNREAGELTQSKYGCITLQWVEGADHGYRVKGRSLEDVIEDIAQLCVDFCKELEITSAKEIDGQPKRKRIKNR